MSEALSHEALSAEVFADGQAEPGGEPTAMHDSNLELVRGVFGMEPETPAQPQGQRQGGQDQPAGDGPATETDLAAVELPQDIKAVAHLPEVAAELSTFRKDARDLGLSRRQAAGVLAKFEARERRLAAQARAEGEADMKKAWGADFPARVSEAKAAMGSLEGRIPGLRKLANHPAVGNSRAFCELLRLAASR